MFLAFDVVEYYFLANVSSRHSVKYKSIAFVIVSNIKLGLVYFSAPVLFFAVATALETLIIGFLGVLFYNFRKPSSNTLWSFNSKRAIQLLKECWPEAIAGVRAIRLDGMQRGYNPERTETDDRGIEHVVNPDPLRMEFEREFVIQDGLGGTFNPETLAPAGRLANLVVQCKVLIIVYSRF